MRYLICIILIISNLYSSNAQNNFGSSDDFSRITINVYIPDQAEKLQNNVESLLQDKITQILTNYSLSGSNEEGRFILVPVVSVLSKEVTATVPAMIVLNLQTNLYIGDGYEGIKFSSVSFISKGLGQNESKAYLDAIKKIKINDQNIHTFIENGKKKILEYYNSNCDFILKDVTRLAENREFDEALYKLSSIPTIAKDCYNKGTDLSILIFKKKIELDCQKSISNARILIAQNFWHEAAMKLNNITPDLACYNEAKTLIKDIQDHNCASSLGSAKAAWASLNYEEAASFLGEIPSDSKCAEEAKLLASQIIKRAKEVDNREWKFKLKVQQNEFSLRSEAINASKEIAIAYAKNRPKVVYNTQLIRGW